MFNKVLYEIQPRELHDNNEAVQYAIATDDHIRLTAWRSYEFGCGEKLSWCNLNTVKSIDSLVMRYESSYKDDWMNRKSNGTSQDTFNRAWILSILIRILSLHILTDSSSDSDLENEHIDESKWNKVQTNKCDLKLFDCPDSSRIRRFQRYSNLQIYLVTGKKISS